MYKLLFMLLNDVASKRYVEVPEPQELYQSSRTNKLLIIYVSIDLIFP